MEKKKALHDYPFENAVSICPQFKLAETDNFKTFKVISNKGIFTIDPRSAHGVESSKNYTNDMQFTSMAVDGKGRFAIGSETGEIRLYKQIGKNANSKFTSTGEPVIHLESTKDGFWLLATFPTFLRLIPTETAENQSLYETKLPYKDRPQPMKL